MVRTKLHKLLENSDSQQFKKAKKCYPKQIILLDAVTSSIFEIMTSSSNKRHSHPAQCFEKSPTL